jgi:hypothetical protein
VRRKGGDGKCSTPFETGVAVRAVGERGAGLGVPRGGGEGRGAGTGWCVGKGGASVGRQGMWPAGAGSAGLLNPFKSVNVIQIDLNSNQTHSNFIRSKNDLT